MALSDCGQKAGEGDRELTEHGSTLFPIACYEDDLEKMSIPWHWHDEVEAILVTEGIAEICVDGNVTPIEQGGGYFVNAGMLHTAREQAGSKVKLHSIVFHPRLIGGGVDSTFWQKYVLPLIEDRCWVGLALRADLDWQNLAMKKIAAAWQECVEETPGYEFRIRSLLSELWYLLWEQHAGVRAAPSRRALRDGERMKTMLQFIQEHYSEELNTEKIAESAALSPSECFRCFQRMIGTPPIQYLKQLRLQTAAELLSSTEEEVGSIGLRCGFATPSYFTKSFREAYRCTPKEYRENQNIRGNQI